MSDKETKNTLNDNDNENENDNDNNNENDNENENDKNSVMDYLDDTEIIDDIDNNDTNTNIKHMILGIDLGTTNSCISIWRNGNCEIIPDEYGNKTIPSYVSFTNVSKYVGFDAKNQKDINVENVFYEIKRLIGRRFDEKPVQDCINLLSYKIIENERQCVSVQSNIRDNKVFTPEEISACVLMKLKDMACKYLKREITDVVITVPAHFNDSQRQATYDAARIAGLNCVRMFHEPTAAALAYGIMDRTINKSLNNRSTKSNSKNDTDDQNNDASYKKNEENGENDEKQKEMLILVYDFGGGTLDISLIDVYDGCFEVLGTSGISHFGGVDFDNRIINYCMAKFSRQYYGKNSFDINELNRVSLQKLRSQSESAKKILSTNTCAYIAVENFHDEKDLFVKINREDFENLCRDLFLLCVHPIEDLMNECSKSLDEINEIILVGGMTRMPYIRELLNNKFRKGNEKSRVNCSINPDEAVSVGAAIQGYLIANKNDAFSDSITLMDVTPLSLGVEVIGGVMDVLIKRNTTIPCEKTKSYSTDTDYIESVMIKIFEGERTMTYHNYKIGEFELDKLPKSQRGIPEIEICFSIDINGIVTVTAFEKDVNEKKSIIVNTNKNGLKAYQLQALIDEAQEQETLDELDRVKKFCYYEIEDLCANIKTNINNSEFKLLKRDITEISNDVEETLNWLKEKTYRDRDVKEFNDILDKIKKKYGVLILHGNLEKGNIKSLSEHIDATTVYGKDDDDEEEEMKQAFEKVTKDEIGIEEGMSDLQIIELKEMRQALMELCNTINNIINSGKINITKNHKQEIHYYIDDIMLWYYSHNLPTKLDYREKMDDLNKVCDNIVERYQNEGQDLFDPGMMRNNEDLDSDKLEKLCLMLLTMIEANQIPGSRGMILLLKNKLHGIVKYIFSYETVRDNQSIANLTLKNNNNNVNQNQLTIISNTVNPHIVSPETIDEEFQNKCREYIKEVNDMCDKMYNNLRGINIKNAPIIAPKITHQSLNVVTDQFDTNKHASNDTQIHGMTLMELMRIKQNEEIEEMINKELDESSCLTETIITNNTNDDQEIKNIFMSKH